MAEQTFAERLRQLVGQESVSGFARRVGLSESLIRKYLAGSEPSLAKANQIARRGNCSLEWLATGGGYQYRQAELVDMAALELAVSLVTESLPGVTLRVEDHQHMKAIVATYQFLRATKAERAFDIAAARTFSRQVSGWCPESAEADPD